MSKSFERSTSNFEQSTVRLIDDMDRALEALVGKIKELDDELFKLRGELDLARFGDAPNDD